MPAEVITFHKMLTGCIQKESRYWEFFVSTYASLAQNLIERHFTSLKEQLPGITQEIFDSIAQEDGSFLREFAGSSEREFLIHFGRKGLRYCSKPFQRRESEVRV